MIVDISKNKPEKSKSYKQKNTQGSNVKDNVVSLTSFSSKKEDESALERILARANKQTW